MQEDPDSLASGTQMLVNLMKKEQTKNHSSEQGKSRQGIAWHGMAWQKVQLRKPGYGPGQTTATTNQRQ